MAESIVIKGQEAAPPPSTEILNVTWADWLNSIPTKVCYRINNWVFIKVRFYDVHQLNFINSSDTMILDNLPYPIPESLRFNDCLPIGEYLTDEKSNIQYLEGFTNRLNGLHLSFYRNAGMLENLVNCYYLNIDFCYEIEE